MLKTPKIITWVQNRPEFCTRKHRNSSGHSCPYIETRASTGARPFRPTSFYARPCPRPILPARPTSAHDASAKRPPKSCSGELWSHSNGSQPTTKSTMMARQPQSANMGAPHVPESAHTCAQRVRELGGTRRRANPASARQVRVLAAPGVMRSKTSHRRRGGRGCAPSMTRRRAPRRRGGSPERRCR